MQDPSVSLEAEFRSLRLICADLASWMVTPDPEDASAARRLANGARTRLWLRFLREHCGIDGILQLQRVLDPPCFYRDRRNHTQHSAKFSHYQTGRSRPDEEQLLRINMIVPGSYEAFHHPALDFVSDPRPGAYVYPPAPTQTTLVKALGYRETDGAIAWRESLNEAQVQLLLSSPGLESLAYTARLWSLACVKQKPREIAKMTKWVYGHLLISLPELQRTGILVPLMKLFELKVFRATRWNMRYAAVQPLDVVYDFEILHVLAREHAPASGWTDAGRRGFWADVILGRKVPEARGAFDTLWILPGADPKADEELQRIIETRLDAYSRVSAKYQVDWLA